MSEFTKGKWKAVDPFRSRVSSIVALEDSGKVKAVAHKIFNDADARLIAAAPELYALLKEELIPTSDYGGILSLSRAAKVRELLARIDGEEVDP